MTRLEKIRNMSDLEMVDFLIENHVDERFQFCRSFPVCQERLERDDLTEEESKDWDAMCKNCLISYLQEEGEL